METIKLEIQNMETSCQEQNSRLLRTKVDSKAFAITTLTSSAIISNIIKQMESKQRYSPYALEEAILFYSNS